MSVTVEALACRDPLSLPSLESDLVHRWLVWDAWVSGRRRVDLHPLVLSDAAHRNAVDVATRAWSLVSAAAERAAGSAAERVRYAFHPDVERLAAASRAAGDLGCVSRVDLLLDESGSFRACEVNADCPGGYNETVALPRLARAAGLRGGELVDPTRVAGQLVDRLIARSGGPGSPRGVIALAYATAYAEDLQICALLERMIVERGGRAIRIAPTALARDGSGVAVRGERVAVLYRFYPVEYMAEQKNLDAIVGAIESGELSSMSSFACIHAQSKLAMARAFAHDPCAASEVFPETVDFVDVPPEQLDAERPSWVVKRDLSRVGDHVFVGALATPEEFRSLVADVGAVAGGTESEARDQAWIAQRYVAQRPIATPWGSRLVTLGVYLLDGAFAGYFARLSPTSHCSHDALVLPVFVGTTGAS